MLFGNKRDFADLSALRKDHLARYTVRLGQRPSPQPAWPCTAGCGPLFTVWILGIKREDRPVDKEAEHPAGVVGILVEDQPVAKITVSRHTQEHGIQTVFSSVVQKSLQGLELALQAFCMCGGHNGHPGRGKKFLVSEKKVTLFALSIGIAHKNCLKICILQVSAPFFMINPALAFRNDFLRAVTESLTVPFSLSQLCFRWNSIY